jgi:toxin ParE1/3/4
MSYLNIYFSEEAESDWNHIFAYSIVTWGDDVAWRYMTSLNKSVNIILSNPEIGKVYKNDIRILPSNKHRIYYKISDYTIYIIRILHENMNEEGSIN